MINYLCDFGGFIYSKDCWFSIYSFSELTIATQNDLMAIKWNACNSFRIAWARWQFSNGPCTGQTRRGRWSAPHNHPSTKDWRESVDTPWTLPLDWDTFEACCILESSGVIQQDLTCVNDSDNLWGNTPCTDFLPFPVSFPSTPASWNHHANKPFALIFSN